MVLAEFDPLGSESDQHVFLKGAPLVQVLAQVRFPSGAATLATRFPATAEAVATAVADAYPIVESGHETGLLLTPAGVQTSGEGSPLLRASDAARTWTLTLGPGFFALTTTSYSRIGDFLDRLDFVAAAVESVVRPPLFERIGVRFTNQMTDPGHLHSIRELIVPQMCAAAGAEVRDGVEIQHSVAETLFKLGDQRMLHARSGLLPDNALFDPGIPSQIGRSFFLDLDSFTAGPVAAGDGVIRRTTAELAETAYRFFRAITVQPLFDHKFGAAS